ncbi:MAG: hypothetical protein WB779_14785 [Ignavibacteriaceae bacterium]
MNRYIVISSHTSEDCKMAVKQFRQYNAGFLTHFEWGCFDNDHTAYAIIEAESHENAKMSVPPIFREKTKVVKLTHFDPMKTKDPAHR